MAVTCDLLSKGYRVRSGINVREADLLFWVKGIDPTPDPSGLLTQSGVLPSYVRPGAFFPYNNQNNNSGALAGAICVDVYILRRPSPTTAYVLARYSTIPWGSEVQTVGRREVRLANFGLPCYTPTSLDSSGELAVTWCENGVVPFSRPQFMYSQYRLSQGILSANDIATIEDNLGKWYVIQSIPHVLVGASITTATSGSAHVEYHYFHKGRVPAVASDALCEGGSFALPALNYLEEYSRPSPIGPVNVGNAIHALPYTTMISKGETLP